MSRRYEGYSDYRTRSSRYGRAGRENPQSDAIVVALTTQILFCVLLLVAMGALKKVDEPTFGRVKEQYSAMTADDRQVEDFTSVVASWAQGAGDFAASVQQAVTSWIARLAGTEPAAEAAQTGDSFSYDYTSSWLAEGAGGSFPVQAGQQSQQLMAPSGTTLAPVMLGGKIIAPVEGVITSSYAYRLHPITGSTDFHTGMDVAAEEGRGILAALPGEVKEVGKSDVYGNYIVLKHATHLETFYAHCSEIIAEEGMKVRQGERIARVGQTGTATGPHLHFEVWADGVCTDPAWVLDDYIQVVE